MASLTGFRLPVICYQSTITSKSRRDKDGKPRVNCLVAPNQARVFIISSLERGGLLLIRPHISEAIVCSLPARFVLFFL